MPAPAAVPRKNIISRTSRLPLKNQADAPNNKNAGKTGHHHTLPAFFREKIHKPKKPIPKHKNAMESRYSLEVYGCRMSQSVMPKLIPLIRENTIKPGEFFLEMQKYNQNKLNNGTERLNIHELLKASAETVTAAKIII
jgi:hypothetical protein